jgi:murein DD-endopeptidase / murein LD-carboxypeptidase
MEPQASPARRMIITADMIPEQFWRIAYDQGHDPDSPVLPPLAESPNCQNFAYALLRHFGHGISAFRSSDLWDDTAETARVDGALRPLDLLLFNRTAKAWGAHVALYLGCDRAIHLSKKQSVAVIWPLRDFQARPEYRVFVGAKRLRALSAAR